MKGTHTHTHTQLMAFKIFPFPDGADKRHFRRVTCPPTKIIAQREFLGAIKTDC